MLNAASTGNAGEALVDEIPAPPPLSAHHTQSTTDLPRIVTRAPALEEAAIPTVRYTVRL